MIAGNLAKSTTNFFNLRKMKVLHAGHVYVTVEIEAPCKYLQFAVCVGITAVYSRCLVYM